jgi:hypothetical protein
MAPKEIEVNHDNYKRLKSAYKNAVANEQISFHCFNSELLTDYAKYMLEHMENVLKINTKKQQK